MNVNDVLRLVEAGFSKQDIMTLASMGTGAAPESAPAPAPDPAPDPAPAPAPAPAPVPAPAAEAAPSTDGLLDAINKLTSTLQNKAIMDSSIKATPAQTAEQVLAEIIHPTFKGGSD